MTKQKRTLTTRALTGQEPDSKPEADKQREFIGVNQYLSTGFLNAASITRAAKLDTLAKKMIDSAATEANTAINCLPPANQAALKAQVTAAQVCLSPCPDFNGDTKSTERNFR